MQGKSYAALLLRLNDQCRDTGTVRKIIVASSIILYSLTHYVTVNVVYTCHYYQWRAYRRYRKCVARVMRGRCIDHRAACGICELMEGTVK